VGVACTPRSCGRSSPSEGVDCTWIPYDQPSQHSTVILGRSEATRTIVWLPQPMTDERATERLPAFLDGADVALVDCTDGTLASAALDECGRRGIATVLDTGSGRPWTRGLLGRADHVVAPETFARKETGLPPEQAALELWRESRPAVCAVTLGPTGGVFVTAEEPERLQRWEPAPVSAVDSCGAGDTFHGAYAWALARGLAAAERFAAATWSAALKTTRLGNEGIPTLAELARRLGGSRSVI
jgi:sugar/nucleoside kinase (ribokinase family)